MAIIKSDKDLREYKYIELENGMKILLIVDSQPKFTDSEYIPDNSNSIHTFLKNQEMCNKRRSSSCSSFSSFESNKRSAASISVHTGNFSDPKNLEGLAHYVEHMLFLGTEKYPVENEQESFISENGGYSNATTDTEITNYHFDISSAYFFEALDRFAQFFICPTFSKDGAQRELHSIESEFLSHKQDDSIRRYRVMFENVAKNHPLSKFSYGNIKSLDMIPNNLGIDVNEEMRKFVKKYYVPKAMCACFISDCNMDELETNIRRIFSKIENKNSNEKNSIFHSFEKIGLPFDQKNSLGHIFYILSVKDIFQLNITFQFPNLFSHYKSLPMEFLGALFGNEGDGSLFAFLKNKGLVLELFAESPFDGFSRNSSSWLFNIEILLTRTGFNQLYDVLNYFFQFLCMIKKQEIPIYIFDELKKISEINFRFRSKSEPLQYVESLADAMHHLPYNDILVGEEVYLDLDRTLIKSLLHKMTPQNCRIDILSNVFNHDLKNCRKEKWFGTVYYKEKISDYQIEKQCSVETDLPKFSFPFPNNYIPKDFSINTNENIDDVNLSRDFLNITFDLSPCLIANKNNFKIWYKLDKEFLLPKTNVLLTLKSNLFYENPISFVLNDIFFYLFDDSIQEFIYPALLTDLSSNFEVIKNAIHINFFGFNDKLFHFIKDVLKKLIDFIPSEDRFLLIKDEMSRIYSNKYLEVDKQAKYVRLLFIELKNWPIETLLNALNLINFSDILNYSKNFCENLQIFGLINGNSTISSAIDLCNYIQQCFKLDTGLKSNLSRNYEKIVRLQARKTLIFKTLSNNSNEKNSAFQFYQQIGPDDFLLRVLVDVLVQLIYEPCFDFLRTKKQIGYDINCSTVSTESILGFVINIVSGEYSPENVLKLVREFVSNIFPTFLHNMAQKDYLNQIEAMILERKYSFTNLQESSNYFYNEICLFNIKKKKGKAPAQNRREIEIDILSKLTDKQEIILFYHDYIYPIINDGSLRSKKLSTLISCVYGTQQQKEIDFDLIYESNQEIIQFRIDKTEHIDKLHQLKKKLLIF